MAIKAIQEKETKGMMVTTKVEENVAVAEEVTSIPVAREKCTKQPAQTVGRKLKCHSSLLKADLYIAESVSRTTDLPEDIRHNQPGFQISGQST